VSLWAGGHRSADTAGKPSLGWRGRRAARKLTDAVSANLPGSSSTLLDSEFADKLDMGCRWVLNAAVSWPWRLASAALR